MLEAFLEKWREGFSVVYGIRRKRPEGALIGTFRRFGYWVIDTLSEHPIPRDVGDFRLIDRKVIDALASIRTANPYLRGMIAGLGFNQTGIPYDRDARVAGESLVALPPVVRVGLPAVFYHSPVPWGLASLPGGVMLGVSSLGALYYLILRLTHPGRPQGLASIHILVLFGVGLQSLLMGILGEYLLRIYLILRAEPVAIIERSLNFSPTDLKL